MSFGLLPEGFVPKTVQDILNEIQADQRQAFGPSIDTTADSVLGILNGIIADRLAELWEVGQALAAGLNPDFASGAQLDAIAALTGLTRLPSSPSLATLRVLLNTGIINEGDLFATSGGAQFEVLAEVENGGADPAFFDVEVQSVENGPIAAPAFAINTIPVTLPDVVVEASLITNAVEPFDLTGTTGVDFLVDGATVSVTWSIGDFGDISSATATEIESLIVMTSGIEALVLSNNSLAIYTTTPGAEGSIQAVAGPGQSALGLSTALSQGYNPNRPATKTFPNSGPFPIGVNEQLTVEINGTVRSMSFPSPSGLPRPVAETAANITSLLPGAVAYVVGTDQIAIETVLTGSEASIGENNSTQAGGDLGPLGSALAFGVDGEAIVGRLVESDAELRQRRLDSLFNAGSGTLDSILAAVRAVPRVTSVLGRQNRTDTVDSNGLPAHSFEIVVEGGTDEDVAQAIFSKQGAGIESHRDPGAAGRTVAVTDSQGVSVDVNFTRTTDVEIWIDITIQIDTAVFGSGDTAAGVTEVENAILAIGNSLKVGDDVLALRFEAAPLALRGVQDVTAFTIDTANPPVGTSNISITDRQRAVFARARIGVTTV